MDIKPRRQSSPIGPKEPDWRGLDAPRGRERMAYERSLYGPERIRPRGTPVAAVNKTHTISINVPDLGAIKRFFKSKRLKKMLLIASVGVLCLFGALQGFKYWTGRDKQAVDPNSIAPEAVYTPQNLPEGYSVGSASQSLDNGALLYTVYDDKGREITVTQQSKPAELDLNMFKDASKFDTILGKAYILESEERITGYILSDQTMILFNSSSGVNSVSLRPLMEAFKP